MKTVILIFLICVSSLSFSQKKLSEKMLESLPANLELKDDLQKFKVTTTHYNGDVLGNFFNKQQICGEYTRGLQNGEVCWNNVSIAFSMSPDRNAAFEQRIPIAYMENFTYLPNEDMIKAEKFSTFTEHAAFTKNLVWDMLAIEGFSWAYFDKLKLNEEFSTPQFNGKIELAGEGFFENKDIRITWTGISKMNDELCATLEYRTLNNPLEIKNESMEMKGRSHYWGTIWVSLQDKQVEHALLFEDVMMELLLSGQTQKQLLNATREITFERIF